VGTYARLREGKRRISALFESSPRRVYSEGEIGALLDEHRAAWGLARRTTLEAFVDFLLSDTHLRRHRLVSSKQREVVRYAWRYPSLFEMALSLTPGGYLSHATAAFLHDLCENVPDTIYVNREQSPKPSPGQDLTQEALNLAFSRPQRASRTTFRFRDKDITLLSGKNTNRLVVDEMTGPGGEILQATSLERTLIDIVVRPAYGGGVEAVLQAYRRAKDRGNSHSMLKTLRKLDYVYPYHQSVGFLMERSGWDRESLSPFRELGLSFDFFLAHGVERTAYDTSWRIHYPAQLSNGG
jgi:hypothetical protein